MASLEKLRNSSKPLRKMRKLQEGTSGNFSAEPKRFGLGAGFRPPFLRYYIPASCEAQPFQNLVFHCIPFTFLLLSYSVTPGVLCVFRC